MSVPSAVDLVSENIRKKTDSFVNTKLGKIFLSAVLIGPLTFLPTVYAAWTSPNIDILRTLTWPLLTIINISALLGVIHNGDWRMRFVMFIWTLMMATIFIATIVR